MYRWMKRISGKVLKLAMVVVFVLTSCLVTQMPVRAAMSLNAQAYAPNTDTQIKLWWSYVQGVKAYTVERRTAGTSDPFVQVAVIDISQTLNFLSYIDQDLIPETGYEYRVTAYSEYNETTQTEIESKTVTASTSSMLPPVILSIQYDINSNDGTSPGGMITLTWKHNSLAATASEIKDASGTVKFEVAGQTTTATFPDSSIKIGSTVSYVVVSKDAYGHRSANSPAKSILPIAKPPIHVSMQNGTATISWSPYSYTQYMGSFSLQRSKYDGTLWKDWETVLSSLSSGTQSAKDTPSAPGAYRYRLVAKENSNYYGNSDISEVAFKPAAPTDLNCVLTAPNKVSLNWVNAEGNLSKLVVQRREGSGNYSNVAELDATETSYEDIHSFVSGSTYYYRIVAFDSENNKATSAEKTISIATPAAPSSLRLSVESASRIVLSWNDNANNEEGFKIERAVDSGSFSEIYTASANTVSYLDETVDSEHTYTYRVRAYNALGNSGYATAVSVSTGSMVTPASFEAKAVSGNQIHLNWTYSGSSTYSTLIERIGGADTSWRTIATVSAGTTSYTDTYNLVPNTRYYYRIRAISGSVYWPYYPSAEGKEATTGLETIALSASAVSGNRIQLSWNHVSGTTQYTVERKYGNGSFTAITFLPSSTTSWYDYAVIPNGQYTYRVKATNAQNQQTYSNEATVVNAYLEAPSDLTAVVNSDGFIELTWVDNSFTETGFEIYRWAYTSSYSSKTFQVEQDTTSFVDTEVVHGVQYYYYIRAYNQIYGIYSATSNSVTTGVGILPPPDGLDYKALSNTSVRLTWNDNSSNESGFKVERRVEGKDEWVEIASLAANTKEYTVAGLSSTVKYYFRIKAYNLSNGIYSYSEEIEVTTRKPLAPKDLKLEVVSSSTIILTWTNQSDNELGFRVERRGPGESTYRQIAELEPGTTSYTDSMLEANRRYYYRVTAYNKNGSATSSAVNAMTKRKVTFSDIQDNSLSWARTAIEDLAGRGVIKGDDANRYRPLENITRAEFISMVIKAFKLEGIAVGAFKDVKPGDWFYEDVMIASSLGIVMGGPGLYMHPNDPITREDMAVIAVRACDAAGKELYRHSNKVLEKYKDRESISPYAISSLATLCGEGILDRWSGSLLSPQGTVTRAEAAVIVYKLLEK